MKIGALEAGGTKMVCAVGNEARLRADESRFDELISYRSGN